MFRVLFEGALAPETDGAQERIFRQRRSCVMNAKKNRALDQCVADCARHRDRSPRKARQTDKRVHVEPGDGAGLAEILHRLGHATEPLVARRAFESARCGGRLVQAPEHLADHSAPSVAD